MNEATTQLLNTLASKLGVATEMLWSCLLRQAPISATVELSSLLIVILAASYGLRRTILTKWDDDEAGAPCLFVLCAVLLIFGTALVIQLPTIIAGFFNPEYWALQQILKK